MIYRLTVLVSFKIILFTSSIIGQINSNHLQWSPTQKITVDDFMLKTDSVGATSSFAQFSVDYQVNGLDFLSRNFNQKVRNYMIRSASWIDTTGNVVHLIRYQQTLFDLCEIYTRRFRKALRENRRSIAHGTGIAQELNDRIMTEFAERRVDYDRETQFGTDLVKQQEWEMQIQKELLDLADFEYRPDSVPK